jgi:KipI family sensor histidine kinase inhibitor
MIGTGFIEPLGEHGWLARFGSPGIAIAWARAVRERGLPGVIDVVAAYNTAAVMASPDHHDLEHLERCLREVTAGSIGCNEPGRGFEVPVLYDGADLAFIADAFGLRTDEVIELHCGVDYPVLAMGFLPGFPYAGPLPERLRGLPRRPRPRPRVPAGSVAMVGLQTGVYPSPSPGGWHLLGRTPLVLADPASGRFPIRAGDTIRFRRIDEAAFRDLLGEPLS